jgi:hypothetical protein
MFYKRPPKQPGDDKEERVRGINLLSPELFRRKSIAGWPGSLQEIYPKQAFLVSGPKRGKIFRVFKKDI